MNIDLEKEKKLAGFEAANFVKEGMIIGLGTGSTIFYLIKRLGEIIEVDLDVRCIVSSNATKVLALANGLKVVPLETVDKIDLTIDGADEFDSQLQLIKGGGGALLHEKILAYNSDFNLIIVDSSKKVDRLGAFRLPIECIPFTTINIQRYLKKNGLNPTMRKSGSDDFVTQEGNKILDLDISKVKDLNELNRSLLEIPGVVETGLFLNFADKVLMGKGEEILEFSKSS